MVNGDRFSSVARGLGVHAARVFGATPEKAPGKAAAKTPRATVKKPKTR
jgi:hypothetical protein